MLRSTIPLVVLVVLARPAAAATVNVPGDVATLQAAIDGAAAGDVIQLAAGSYSGQVVVIDKTAAVVVRGDTAHPDTVVLDGGGVGGGVVRIVGSTAGVIFEGVTITGGTGGTAVGGGIFMADSSVVFRHCIVRNNTSEDGAGAFLLRGSGVFQHVRFTQNVAQHLAGGLLMNLGATPVFDHCEFDANQSGADPAFRGYAGGLLINQSSPTFVGCAIHDNVSEYSAGGVAITAPSYDGPRVVTTFQDCSITNNHIDTNVTTDLPSEGGGIHVEDNAKVVLTRCRVAGNVANRGAGINAYRAVYEITDSVIEDNTAVPVNNDAGTGGGFYAASVNTAPPVRDPAEIHLVRSLVRGNTAMQGGGIYAQGDFMSSSNQVVVTLEQSIVADNQATDNGGGLYLNRAHFDMHDSQLLDNAVTGANGIWGGGLLAADGSVLTIDDSTFAGNTTPVQGGAIFADRGGTVNVTNSRFSENRANSDAGGENIAIGQSDGAVPAPITGTVSGNVFVSTGSEYAIYEADCDLTRYSTVLYTNNHFGYPNAQLYTRSCNGPVSGMTAFNALSGKASGNVRTAVPFAHILAAPATINPGGTATLGAVAVGLGAPALSPGGALGTPVTLSDVTPTVTTAYDLRDGASTLDTATVTVGCDALGIPIPTSPGNGQSGQSSGAGVTLDWLAADGADHYDVYLDTNDDPTTAIATGLTATSFLVSGLQPGATYRWKVVATSAACAQPVASPVFSFSTCATAFCEWRWRFDSPDEIADWQKFGNGTAQVGNGALSLTGKKLLGLLPATPALTDATVEMTIANGRRREVHFMAYYASPSTYVDVIGTLPAGRWKMRERIDGAKHLLGHGRAAVPRGTSFTLQLRQEAGGGLHLYQDGVQILQGVGTPRSGQIAIGAGRGVLAIDELAIMQGAPK